LRDYLGFYIANGFPPLPQRERVEIIGFIHCDGWPRSGRGIPFQNHAIVAGRCGGRFKVTKAQITRARQRMVNDLISDLSSHGYKNIDLVFIDANEK
jgi:hypothetical protein